MSFPLLLQQQGVQLRSWHRTAPSRLLCRTCLLVRRQHQQQLHTKPSLGVFGSSNHGSGILGSSGHCRWNFLKQQQPAQQPYQQYIASPIQPQQQRYLHLTSPETDKRLQELVTLLSHPPTYQRQSSKTTSNLPNINGRRNYKKRLAFLYDSIRRNLEVWHQLTSQQLYALHQVLRLSVNDPSPSNLLMKAQLVLLDIQQRTPQRFGMVHVEALLSTYNATGQVDKLLDLVEWANTKQLSLSLTAYEWVIATLTTTARTSKQQQQPMDLALHYWDQVKAVPPSETTVATMERITGYIIQGFLAQGDLMRAATWLKTHTDPSNVAMQQVLDQWKTASIMGGDDQYYAVGVVSYGLEKLIQQTVHLDRYSDAQLFYQQQCRLFSSNNNKMDSSSFSGSLQQKQSTVGLIRLTERCMATNKETMLQQLLQDTLDLGHTKGTKIVAHRLLHYWLAKNKLRQAADVYFRMDALEQEQQLPRCFDMTESLLLLSRTAKAKYHTDMYRLYQRFITLYPTSLDLRTYTHILQTLIRTKNYDEARAVFEYATHHPLVLTPTGSSASGLTTRLFHLMYSLCAQMGDLDLFKTAVDMQRKAGFPKLHHHALTSLMATYIKMGDTASAKAVFDHLAHRLEQQQQPTQHPPTPPTTSMDDYGNDNHTIGTCYDADLADDVSDVDVVDFNLLMRTIRVEHDKYQQQQHTQQAEPVANRVLDILRHMTLVGVPLDTTTLRTLLGIYAGEEHMEDKIFMTLLNDPKATRHDDIWLNNLKLTRLVYGNDLDDKDECMRLGRIKAAADVFLSDDRRLLFPMAPRDTSILANGMTYKLLLDALTRYPQHAPMAQRIFDHMRNRGWRPSMVMYEQMVNVWARKTRLQKVLAVMQVACDDLGWTDAPVKWYTLVLDRLVAQDRLDLAKKWTLEIKKNKTLSVDRVFKKRLITYGLAGSSSLVAVSHRQH